ncbi:MAG: SDR family oxidoreductase [Actinobacteria bacterium]|uniref:Unannotated protein n=1 Tax=freshwater metagenome TaxID=449393 RepID=A0A6J7S488_9ZZZZ|nr:SDR family oxidoreductase [Actinomycetota bacterium]
MTSDGRPLRAPVQPFVLSDKVAIITGAASGIGATALETLSEAGAHVRGCDISALSGKAHPNLTGNVEVRDPLAVGAFVQSVIDEFGRIDIVVNCAGVGITADEPTPVHLMSDRDWELTLGVNLTGTFNVCRACIPAMLDGGGSIINISSVMGHVGNAGASAYTASKAGVLGLTRSMALEYARQGLRANAICPGFIDTPMVRRHLDQSADGVEELRLIEASHPVGRLGTSQDIANAILWLAADASSFMTGAALTVDGGYTAA